MRPETFYAEVWQRKGAVFRNAISGLAPVASGKLWSLAASGKTESRLIFEHGQDCPWQVEHGPLRRDASKCLPDEGWSLLIHEADSHVPHVTKVLEHTSFMPRWLLDDVMISIAPTGGSVGPHIDRYDAFLVQVAGRRRWQLEDTPREEDPVLVEGADLAVLADFAPDRDYVLEPGDVLYVPPGLAHHGVALEEAQTWSIGLRAPSAHDLVLSYMEEVLDDLPFDALYRAADLRAPGNQGELTPQNIAAFREMLDHALQASHFESWLGRHLTRPRGANALGDAPDADSLTSEHPPLELGPGVRSGYINHDDHSLELFVDGDAFHIPASGAELARRLANGEPITDAGQCEETTRLLASLHARGLLSER